MRTVLKVLLLDHHIAVDIPGYHERNHDHRNEQSSFESKSLVALSLGAIAIHANCRADEAIAV